VYYIYQKKYCNKQIKIFSYLNRKLKGMLKNAVLLRIAHEYSPIMTGFGPIIFHKQSRGYILALYLLSNIEVNQKTNTVRRMLK